MKKNIHVLLIEDDPDDVELLETAFKDEGASYKFTVISHADQVFAYLDAAETLPDIVLLDLNLPRAHGKEILTNIKASAKYKKLPVIILTTSGIQSDVDFCLKAGADHYFTKPNRLFEFHKIVNTVIKTAG